MLIYGVYDVYGCSYGETLEIDRYYLSKEKALDFMFEEGGPDADITEWIVELELIE